MRVNVEFEWWALPGPRGFVHDVADALESGRSVVLGLPEGTPAGLLDHLIADLDGRATLDWRTADLAVPGRVAQILAKELMPMARVPPRAFATDIALDQSLHSTVIHVVGIERPDRFREFAAFLYEFHGSVRKAARLRHSTPRLIFELPRALLGNPRIQTDPELVRVIEWEGRVKLSDMQLYVAVRMLGRGSFGPTNVMERIVVELAGWDPSLADLLVKWSDRELLSPLEKLKELGKEWKVRPLSWEGGTLDSIGGRRLPHLMQHIVANEQDEVRHRLWRAHVAEVFPWLEELRVDIVDEFRNQIRLPHVLQNDDIIYDPHLLEIGQLYWNLRHRARIPERRLRLVNLCRLARNDLAHRRPVDATRLQMLEREWRMAHAS